MNPAEITTWTRNQERTRAAYRAQPTATGRRPNRPWHTCARRGCGAVTRSVTGLCLPCRKETP